MHQHFPSHIEPILDKHAEEFSVLKNPAFREKLLNLHKDFEQEHGSGLELKISGEAPNRTLSLESNGVHLGHFAKNVFQSNALYSSHSSHALAFNYTPAALRKAKIVLAVITALPKHAKHTAGELVEQPVPELDKEEAYKEYVRAVSETYGKSGLLEKIKSKAALSKEEEWLREEMKQPKQPFNRAAQ